MADTCIKDVSAVTKVFGDGEKLSAVTLAYNKTLAASLVSKDDYSVDSRNIQKIYVSATPNLGDGEAFGKYVIIELEPLAMVDSSVDPHPEDKEARAKRNAMGVSGPTLGSKGNPKPIKPITAKISQIKEIKAQNGEICAPQKDLISSSTRRLVIENFVQDVYKDPSQNDAELMYNLYIPKSIDKDKRYPLVLFMHDAGTVSPEIKATLSQGLGAVAWADPLWQDEHPSFVLAPQYDTIIVNDKYQYGPELARTINLIKFLSEKYPIDMKRIYNTGQSMGGMSVIQMDVSYPDFFAASYIVASKWDANITAPLGKQNIFAAASQGDPGASPSMDEILGNLEKNGACVKRITLDVENQSKELINQSVKNMIEPNCHIYYTIYKGGSHRSTWQHAYSIRSVMEWVFSNKK